MAAASEPASALSAPALVGSQREQAGISAELLAAATEPRATSHAGASFTTEGSTWIR